MDPNVNMPGNSYLEERDGRAQFGASSSTSLRESTCMHLMSTSRPTDPQQLSARVCVQCLGVTLSTHNNKMLTLVLLLLMMMVVVIQKLSMSLPSLRY